MKAVLISIQPKWCNLIAQGKKTVEVRKTKPKLETPFKCYIYMTKNENNALEIYEKDGNSYAYSVNYHMAGKVIGEFVCKQVEQFTVGSLRSDDIEKLACLTYKEMIDYFYKPEELDGNYGKFGYAWHISDIKIYDKPKQLGAFRKIPKSCTTLPIALCSDKCDDCFWATMTRPPQSWCYVED